VHEDVGLEVGKEIIYQEDSRGTRPPNACCGPICKRLARNGDGQTLADPWLDEVKKGECGPQLKKCLHDVITERGYLNEADMKEQITIRMTKTMYQDSKLIRHTIAELIGFASDDLRNEWSQQADPHVAWCRFWQHEN
jgi:hypothetical protein